MDMGENMLRKSKGWVGNQKKCGAKKIMDINGNTRYIYSYSGG